MKKGLFLFLASVVMLLSSCEKKEDIAISKITLDQTNLNMVVGESKTLVAQVSPENVSDFILVWESSATDIATVDTEGTVTAIKEGDAIIKVLTEDRDKSAMCLVKVVNAAIPVENVTLSETELSLEEGETAVLEATVLPENATNKNIVWSSTDNTIASVDANGMIVALKEGEAEISVTSEDGNKTAVCKVNVQKPTAHVSGINLDKTSCSINVGTSIQLIYTIVPENAVNKEVSWTSSSTAIAEVDDNGIVKGISEGEAVITVKTEDGGKTASCSVVVIPEDTAIPDYIDDNGINQGKGIKIGDQIWAPVNCGYDKDKFPYGKYYQWGRKQGLGYEGEQDVIFVDGKPESMEDADPDTYYSQWNALAVDGTWGTESPWNIKNEANDPCPEGWRVPNYEELEMLVKNYSQWTEFNGQNGRWCSGETPYEEAGSAQIFMPAGGYIKGMFSSRTIGGYYHSSTPKGSLSKYFFISSDQVASGNFFRYQADNVRCIYDSKE